MLNTPRRRFAYRMVKPWLDKVFALLLLILLAPALLIALLAVRLTSPGPLLHRRRIAGNPPFDAFKIRTMRVDADQVLENDPALRGQWLAKRKIAQDPRVTPVGRILRRWAVDEFPQLVNVLRGEMSLVGPRILTAEELDVYGDQVDLLLSVKPGITGLWQVSGRHRLPPPERVRLDLEYVRNCSLALDVSIVLRTPAAWLGIEPGW